MALKVQKFGGTSVGSPERILRVARKIAATRALGHDIVVVVSAMGDTTDDLIALAHQVSASPHEREMDMLLTAGERISMALLSMALSDLGVPALSFTGSQSGIITTSHHQRARIRTILGDRVKGALSQNKVAIVAGFQGVSQEKEVTTLGRGGSDTTAVALACALSAESCEIYTDVDGIYSADPRKVPGARLWKELPTPFALEMAVRGAGVLHPRCVELAREFGVELWVKNSLNESEGTRMTKDQKGFMDLEKYRIVGVTADVSKILVNAEFQDPGCVNELTRKLAEVGVVLVSPVFDSKGIRFFVDKDSETELTRIFDALHKTKQLSSYTFHSGRVPLSVVGSRFLQDSSGISEVLNVLKTAGIPVELGSVSTLSITLAVPANEAERAVRTLHERLIERV